jgi:hypothetical protein
VGGGAIAFTSSNLWTNSQNSSKIVQSSKANLQSSSKAVQTAEENPTIQRALKEFNSVAAFDQRFSVDITTNRPESDVHDSSYIISVQAVTGHGGWALAPKESDEILSEITDKDGNVLYTIKGNDPRGTTIGKIREALETRDATENA